MLGCVNSHLVTRGNWEAGFTASRTQPFSPFPYMYLISVYTVVGTDKFCTFFIARCVHFVEQRKAPPGVRISKKEQMFTLPFRRERGEGELRNRGEDDLEVSGTTSNFKQTLYLISSRPRHAIRLLFFS